jgi:hypothetical protein
MATLATEPSECAGSWRPIPHLEPGDDVICDQCKRQVFLRPAPLDLASTRWPGEKHARIEPHSVVLKTVMAVSEQPGSEG